MAVLKIVIGWLVYYLFGAVTEHLRKLDLERAAAKADELDRHLQSVQKTGEVEQGLARIIADASAAKEEKLTAQAKLDQIRKFNEWAKGIGRS